jgi:hypothetical protein
MLYPIKEEKEKKNVLAVNTLVSQSPLFQHLDTSYNLILECFRPCHNISRLMLTYSLVAVGSLSPALGSTLMCLQQGPGAIHSRGSGRLQRRGQRGHEAGRGSSRAQRTGSHTGPHD